MSLFDKYEKVEESGMKGWYRLGVVLSAAYIVSIFSVVVYEYRTLEHIGSISNYGNFVEVSDVVVGEIPHPENQQKYDECLDDQKRRKAELDEIDSYRPRFLGMSEVKEDNDLSFLCRLSSPIKTMVYERRLKTKNLLFALLVPLFICMTLLLIFYSAKWVWKGFKG
jgi:hypothetical protein